MLTLLVAPESSDAPTWWRVVPAGLLGAALLRLAFAGRGEHTARARWRLAAVPAVYFLGLAALGAVHRVTGAEPPR